MLALLSDHSRTTDESNRENEEDDALPPSYNTINETTTQSLATDVNKMKKADSGLNGDVPSVLKNLDMPRANSSTSRSKWLSRQQIICVCIALLIGIGLTSALGYFIVLSINQAKPGECNPKHGELGPGARASVQNSDGTACCFNPCVNSGTCKEANETSVLSFSCDCQHPYEGLLCHEMKDICATNPCLNSGTCSASDTDPFYSCACGARNTGHNCELTSPLGQPVQTSFILPKCSDMPNFCHHDGTCVETGSGIQCQCRNGFTGARCGTIIEATTTPAP